ncbi:MAG: response regulator, partial [Gammaproteobacteria bacterium]
ANGTIKIYSEEGFGTTVSISIPSVEVNAGKIKPMWSSDDFSGSGRILLVEDEQALLLACATWLRSLGYEVTTAENGEQALSLFREAGAHFDLLLTDVVMPGEVDGIQLAEEAKKHDPKIKVVYMSGFTGLVASETLFARDNLLTKPFRKRDLGRIIKANIHTSPSNFKGVEADVQQDTKVST